MKKIGFIAPYDEIGQIALNENTSENYELIVRTGYLQSGVRHAIELINLGCEVLISRGGTYQEIKKVVNVPIVEIKITGFDLMRAIYPYRIKKKNLAAIGFENVIKGVKAVSDIINYNIDMYIIRDEKNVQHIIDEANRKGADIVIGDVSGTEEAKKFGIDCLLIESGTEAIVNAINEAIEIYEALEIERKKQVRLQTILDFANEGIVASDIEGNIELFNPEAEKLLNIERSAAWNTKIWDILPDSNFREILRDGIKEIGVIQKTNKYIIATNCVPVTINGEIKGAITTLQNVTKIQQIEEEIRRKFHEKGFTAKKSFDDIVGNSDLIKKTINLSKKYSQSDSTILISGESGTGKEIFAQAIHNHSQRNQGPFVAVNCAAIASNLLESELFGYVEGAFTGAKKGGKKGLFEIAHKGTIFLDEISEMDIGLQSRLLRVLQEREVMRVGDDKVIPVDIRIIAATNKNLAKEVQKNRFRKDLFYRINVLNIKLPSLKERTSDISILSDFFIDKFNRKYKVNSKKLSSGTIDMLKRHNWGGNIRELENVIEKIVIIGENEFMEKDNIDLVFKDVIDNSEESKDDLYEKLMQGTLDEIQKRIICKILEEEDFNKTNTAKRLKITRTTLNNKLKASNY